MRGPFDMVARGGYLYLIILTVDYPWYRYMHKIYISEAFELFKEFRYEVEKQIKKFERYLNHIKEVNT